MDQKMIPAVDLNIFSYLLYDSNGIPTHNLVRKWTLNHLAKFWTPLQSLTLCAYFQQGIPWNCNHSRV